MTNFADTMAIIDSALDASLISDDLTLPDGTTIRGRMVRDVAEFGTDEGGTIRTSTIMFRTAFTEAVAALKPGEWAVHAGNRYIIDAREPDRGDALGRVDLILRDGD